ncbi:MAG: hypothetical protein M0Z32_09120, partial [Actinomycetota bacterium]|nr:hypothetical protein [Actinomycetota bacterium]MDA8167881.1 hypothetical protein [Actinomycetota bacterium]
MNKQAERRLQVEAAIQALGLLRTGSGKEVAPTQRAAVVLTLCDLGMFPVAVALVDQMLSTSSIDPGVACWVVDKVINSKSSDYDAKYSSMVMLRSHVSDLLLLNGIAEFPDSVCDKGFVSIQPRAIRQIGILALIDLLVQRPFKEWIPASFFFFFDPIYFIYRNDEDEDIRRNAGIALSAFVKAYNEPDQILELKEGPKTISESPRLSWRLHLLRGWSHEHTKAVSQRAEGTCGADGARPQGRV